MGIYQIYMTTAIICFLYFLIVKLMDKNEDNRLKDTGIRFSLSIICGICIYFAANAVILMAADSVLSDYQGISSIGKMCVRDLLYAFIKLVKSGVSFYFGGNNISIYSILNLLFLLLAILLWIYYVLMNKAYSLSRKLLISICLCLTVFSTYAFLFASAGTTYHMIMQIGNYFAYFGVIILLERKIVIQKNIYKIIPGLLCFLCFYHFVNNNIAYKQMEMSYEKTCFETIEILNKIDGINNNGIRDIAIIGEFRNNEQTQLLKAIPDITGASENNFLHSPFHFLMFTQYYFNRTFIEIDSVKLEKIKQTEEFQKMPVHPNNSSVQVIDGTIVVKLEDEDK